MRQRLRSRPELAQKVLGRFADDNRVEQYNSLNAFIQGHSTGRPLRPPLEPKQFKSSKAKTLFFILLFVVVTVSFAVYYFNIPVDVPPEVKEFARSASENLKDQINDKLEQFYK